MQVVVHQPDEDGQVFVGLVPENDLERAVLKAATMQAVQSDYAAAVQSEPMNPPARPARPAPPVDEGPVEDLLGRGGGPGHHDQKAGEVRVRAEDVGGMDFSDVAEEQIAKRSPRPLTTDDKAKFGDKPPPDMPAWGHRD